MLFLKALCGSGQAPYGWRQTLQSSDPASGDYFGYSVAVTPDAATIIVGAPEKSYLGNPLRGAAYVFTRSGSTWSQQAKLLGDTSQAGFFGYAVAISTDGNTAAIGAKGISGGGAVYVFTRSGTTWTQQAVLQGTGAYTPAALGTSVALSDDGNLLFAGAPFTDVTTTDSGAVWSFTRSGTTWTQQTIIKPNSPIYQEYFGSSVAISGITYYTRRLLVGATGSLGGRWYSYDSLVSAPYWGSQAVYNKPGFTAANFDEFGGCVCITPDKNYTFVSGYAASFGYTYPTLNVGLGARYTFNGASYTNNSVFYPTSSISYSYTGSCVRISDDGKKIFFVNQLADYGGYTDVGNVFVYISPFQDVGGGTVLNSYFQAIQPPVLANNILLGYAYSNSSMGINSDGSIIAVGAPYGTGGSVFIYI